MDDVESDSVDNHQPVAINDSDDVDSDVVNNSLLLQRLINATTSLEASMDNFSVKANEMKTRQSNMEAKISRIEDMVFNNRRYEIHSEKTMNGHANNALNEASTQVDGAKPDANDANDAKPDFDNDANIRKNAVANFNIG